MKKLIDCKGRLWVVCKKCHSRFVLAGKKKIDKERFNRMCQWCKKGKFKQIKNYECRLKEVGTLNNLELFAAFCGLIFIVLIVLLGFKVRNGLAKAKE